MRMRKVKWAVDYLNDANCLIEDPSALKGTWKERFDQKKIHVEIGCGKGNYSLTWLSCILRKLLSRSKKMRVQLGIAAKKFDDANQQENLVLIQKDAANISEWFAAGEVDVIHLNFSDPWPKKRYAKRRLSSSQFLDQYAQILSDEGQIQMKTDNSSLFEYSLIEFQNAGYRMIEISVDYRRETHDEDVMTEYEEKFCFVGTAYLSLCLDKKQ